jgi:hypothetical protein
MEEVQNSNNGTGEKTPSTQTKESLELNTLVRYIITHFTKIKSEAGVDEAVKQISGIILNYLTSRKSTIMEPLEESLKNLYYIMGKIAESDLEEDILFRLFHNDDIIKKVCIRHELNISHRFPGMESIVNKNAFNFHFFENIFLPLYRSEQIKTDGIVNELVYPNGFISSLFKTFYKNHVDHLNSLDAFYETRVAIVLQNHEHDRDEVESRLQGELNSNKKQIIEHFNKKMQSIVKSIKDVDNDILIKKFIESAESMGAFDSDKIRRLLEFNPEKAVEEISWKVVQRIANGNDLIRGSEARKESDGLKLIEKIEEIRGLVESNATMQEYGNDLKLILQKLADMQQQNTSSGNMPTDLPIVQEQEHEASIATPDTQGIKESVDALSGKLSQLSDTESQKYNTLLNALKEISVAVSNIQIVEENNAVHKSSDEPDASFSGHASIDLSPIIDALHLIQGGLESQGKAIDSITSIVANLPQPKESRGITDSSEVITLLNGFDDRIQRFETQTNESLQQIFAKVEHFQNASIQQSSSSKNSEVAALNTKIDLLMDNMQKLLDIVSSEQKESQRIRSLLDNA